jgi:hypothetical protein
MPPPTADRLKVRCYRCNQLLAVAPSKAGTVVACPKCKSELLIPRPEPQPSGDEPTDSSVVALKSGTFPALAPVTESATTGREGGSSPSFLDEISALIPPEVAALRPEDLRVEAEVFGAINRQPSPPPPAEDPFSFPGRLSAADLIPPPATVEPIPAAPQDVPAFSTSAGSAPVATGTAAAPPPLPISVPAPEANIVVPPIRLEPEAIRPPVDAEPRGIREVLLPASVVLAWSLFVLSAIPMAFVAGLMIGHFLWRTGP